MSDEKVSLEFLGEQMLRMQADLRGVRSEQVRLEGEQVSTRADLKHLITEDLIREHRATFGKRRSDALERVLTYFRSAAAADKYAVLSAKPFAEYRIVALSGRRGVPPRAVDDQVFTTAEEALHGVFLKRVQDLMES